VLANAARARALLLNFLVHKTHDLFSTSTGVIKGTILGVQLRFFSIMSEFDNSEKYRFMLDLGLWFVVARCGSHDAFCHAIRVPVVPV
jgi:hypothetical protein